MAAASRPDEQASHPTEAAAGAPSSQAGVSHGCPAHRPSSRDETSNAAPGSQDSDPATLLTDAQAFLTRYFHETERAGLRSRLTRMRREVEASGTWWQTADELAFGARLAWRNAERCIGRARWSALHVRDLRGCNRAHQIRTELENHLNFSTNGGAIVPMISIFAPASTGEPAVRIRNPQLIRYAGWTDAHGNVTGDPAQTRLTDQALQLGWRGPSNRTRFDVLPWIIDGLDIGPALFPVPASSVLEVELRHPQHPWFALLGLRWPALPAISDMTLRVGGVIYPCAFSGSYMASEIASRNLADPTRYNQLPAVARGLGLDVRRDRLWRDKALLVLNEAVLWSFHAAGVRITDHHRESITFARFTAREEAAGRPVYGDWSWLNSYPMTPQDPSWGRYYASPPPRDPGLHASAPVAP
ncbi:nitric-oxide synthase [Micromonospora nigra]|uniref:Nitric-oxide synthase n=2 Tax=Micromonospora nigra TaxID=145857 RepID=A0A1C6R7X4_9ACTN|nr:nitric-oxide synthase [Micromonospora nigra]